MSDTIADFGPSLRGCNREDWIDEVAELVDNDGYLSRLGKKHIAAFTEHGKTLLVSFETLQGVQSLSPKAHPVGWELVKARQWSSLSVISDGDTWFRDPAVYAYFDRLVDDGFFDEFDTVLFYGVGSCGYAATAFSVVAPGSLVLAIQPQATLAPHLTEWDRRFPNQRRNDFVSRYGFAPDMIEASACTTLIYDPFQIEDAMHAALFNRSNVTKLHMPFMGGSLQVDILQMGFLQELILLAGDGELTPVRFGKITRVRRDHATYLRRLLAQLDDRERPDLIRLLCRNVTTRMHAPRFARRLERLEQESA